MTQIRIRVNAKPSSEDRSFEGEVHFGEHKFAYRIKYDGSLQEIGQLGRANG